MREWKSELPELLEKLLGLRRAILPHILELDLAVFGVDELDVVEALCLLGDAEAAVALVLFLLVEACW